MKNIILSFLLGFIVVGCAAKVPMDSIDNDKNLKEFNPPPEGKSGVYVYRDSLLGRALTKRVDINGKTIGETAPDVFFYETIEPGSTTVATQSEFSDNLLTFNAEKNKNHFVRQYIKIGVFIGGADLELVDEEKGKEGVLKTNLALSYSKQ